MTGPRQRRAVAGLRPTARPAVRPAGHRRRVARGPGGRGRSPRATWWRSRWCTSVFVAGVEVARRLAPNAWPRLVSWTVLVDGVVVVLAVARHRRLPQPAPLPRVPRRRWRSRSSRRTAPASSSRSGARSCSWSPTRRPTPASSTRTRRRRRPRRDRQRGDLPPLRAVRRAVLVGQRTVAAPQPDAARVPGRPRRRARARASAPTT